MEERPGESLEQRVENLERLVSELRGVVGQMHEVLLARKQPGTVPRPLALPSDVFFNAPVEANPSRPMRFPTTTMAGPAPKIRREVALDGEFWLNKVGIGLLLLGVVFLFKYSVDQGWLSPALRVGLGLLLGSALLAMGLRLRGSRPAFGQVLQGGGVAAFYITGFAAYTILELVGYRLAFGFMVATTLLAFALALRQDDAIQSLIGAIGGFGTPFLLPTRDANLAGLVAYTSLLVAGTLAVDFAKGWRSLRWTAFIGGWTIFVMAVVQDRQHSQVSRWALQAGIAFGWLAFGVAAVAREGLGKRISAPGSEDPADIRFDRVVSRKGGASFGFGDLAGLTVGDREVMVILTPLLALPLSMWTWASTAPIWGMVALGASAVYGPAWLELRRRERGLSAAHGVVSVLLLTTALVLLLPADVLLVSLAALAAAALVAARRVEEPFLAVAGHGLFLAVGLWLVVRLASPPGPWMALDFPPLADLAAIGLALAASAVVRPREAARTYQLAANVAFLGWLWRPFAAWPNGGAIVTILWGIDAVALLLLGLRQGLRVLLKFGMGTLLVVVGKLLLIDLASLDPLWRILMFLGFGGLLLLLSYYFPQLWRPAPKAPGAGAVDWAEIGPSGPPRG